MRSALLRTLPTGTRRSVRSILASVVAVVLATGGILVASALPAQAHTTTISSSCQSLTLDLTYFAPVGGPDDVNTITVTVDGRVVDGWDRLQFGETLDPNPSVISLGDPSVAHTWQVDIYARDDPDGAKGWTTTKTGTSTACVAPTIAARATTCTIPGGSAGITADLTGIAPADAYRVELLAGGAVVWTQSYAPGKVPTPIDIGPQRAGVTYTVRVTDVTLSLSSENSVTAAACPQVGGSSVEIAQCLAPGGASTVTLTPTGFVPGHRYTVRTGSATGAVVGDFVYATGGAYPIRVAAPTSGTSDVILYVVDDQGGVVSAGPLPVTLEACPTQPQILSIVVDACSVGNATSGVTVNLSGLTPGRSYQPTVDGTRYGAVVTTGSTTDKLVLRSVPPGSYSVGVYDVAAPGVAVTQAVAVAACPMVPKTTLDATQCTTPGGSNNLGVSLQGLVVGRSYTVTVSSPSSTIMTVSLAATQTTASVPVGSVPTGADYAVEVVDVGDPAAASTTVIRMDGCPQVAALSVECTTSAGVATLAFAASDLASGQVWTVRFERQDAAGAFTTISERTNLTTVTPADLRLPGVDPGQTYRVSILSQTNASLSDSLVVPVPEGCASGRVGGVSYTAGGSVSALAVTGTDTGRLALVALFLVLPGAGLIGFALLRRRREAGE